MRYWTRPDLQILAGLYLQNQKCFVVRRCVQRFLAGEISSREPHATGPYEPWRPATVTIAGAQPHPTPLVQSAAMAAVAHPRPAYRPKLPVNVIGKGRLSDAQLESIILAGQAHERRLPAHVRIGEGWETLQRVDGAAHSGPADGGSANGSSANGNPADGSRSEDGEVLSSSVRFRRGWMLGDGTGCGKGRQVAGIVLDQRLRGNRRALWLSASDKLLEDARRDWTAIGGVESDVIPLTKIRTGKAVPQAQGILFATYATLRSPARQGRQSRLKQIVEWLAGGLDEDSRHGFSGVIVFDEAHAMANAAGSKGTRGDVAPSQQGRAGLRLQNALPDVKLADVLLPDENEVDRLRYFTARVSGIANAGAPGRQHVYLQALGTLPEVRVHMGRFLAKTAWRPLTNLPVADRRIEAPAPVTLPPGNHPVEGGQTLPVGRYPAMSTGKKKRRKASKPAPDAVIAEVHVMEEKGSDVNLGAHLLNDAWKSP